VQSYEKHLRCAEYKTEEKLTVYEINVEHSFQRHQSEYTRSQKNQTEVSKSCRHRVAFSQHAVSPPDDFSHMQHHLQMIQTPESHHINNTADFCKITKCCKNFQPQSTTHPPPHTHMHTRPTFGKSGQPAGSALTGLQAAGTLAYKMDSFLDAQPPAYMTVKITEGLQKLDRLTNITIFHFSDVRPQSAVCRWQGRCKFVVTFIQHHCKQREVVIL